MAPKARKTVVAVDGPAASGKGTFARNLAAALGYAYLDTGALYRLIAWTTLQNSGDPAQVADVLPALSLIKYPDAAELVANPALRTGEAAELASVVSTYPEVRAVVHAYQDAFMQAPPGNAPGVVLDGRDIGTVICPDAEVKIYVTATVEERARRRFADLQKKDPGLTFETVLNDIAQRDKNDMERPLSPLRPAADAYILDNTNETPEQSLARGLAVARAKLAAKKNYFTKKSGPKP